MQCRPRKAELPDGLQIPGFSLDGFRVPAGLLESACVAHERRRKLCRAFSQRVFAMQIRSSSLLLACGIVATIAGGWPKLAPASAPDRMFDGLNWRLVGPQRGGWGTVAVGVADQPDTFYFGAAGGGVWKSLDAGRTWQPIFDHGPASVGALAVAPSDPRVIYAGTGQVTTRYDIAAGEGVFKSTDAGASWHSVGLDATRHIGEIWVDPRNADVVMVAALGHEFGANPERGVF